MFKRQTEQRGDKARNPHPGIPYSLEQVLHLISYHKGNMSRMADAIGTTRHGLYDYCQRNPLTKQALSDERERYIDKIELSVLQRAHEGTDTQLQKFVLQTQAKHRGWGDDSNKEMASTLAREAFDFVVNRSKNPAERKQ